MAYSQYANGRTLFEGPITANDTGSYYPDEHNPLLLRDMGTGAPRISLIVAGRTDGTYTASVETRGAGAPTWTAVSLSAGAPHTVTLAANGTDAETLDGVVLAELKVKLVASGVTTGATSVKVALEWPNS